jgi:putative FmdB family regulatory protein
LTEIAVLARRATGQFFHFEFDQVFSAAMPIYAYRCDSCGHQKDVLQKVSDPLLTECPACGKPTFTKQVTAAGFQLKGSGWYVSDFRSAGDGANSGVGKPVEASKDSSVTPPAAAQASPAVASAPAAAASPPAAASLSPSPAPAAAA